MLIQMKGSHQGEEQIREKLRRNAIETSEDVPKKLFQYFQILKEWNTRMDLTAVQEDEEMLDRHFVDSLIGLQTGLIQTGKTLIDVGTGAGFPGMVLSIACPELKSTLMDSQEKRLTFLRAVKEAVGAENVELLHARAEEAGKNRLYREQFDLATARAVAPLNVLCEYLLPFVKKGGTAMCWKGPALREELEPGRNAAALLGGEVGEPFSCRIEGRDWNHLILSIEKKTSTPKIYPRKAGTPKQNPLGTTPQ